MDADVIVIGAGPVGLLAACELARGGVRVIVVDRLDRPSDALKGNGLVGHIVPVLKRRGYLRGQRSLVAPRYQFGPIPLVLWRHRAGALHILPIPQRRLEALLAKRAEELGVEVRRGFEVDDVSQSDESVLVSAGKNRLSARYAIGCDGAKSPVRKRLGIDFVGFTSDSVSTIARVLLPEHAATVVGDELRLADSSSLMLFRQNSTERGAVTVAPARALDSSAPAEEYILSVTQRRSGGDDDPTVEELRVAVADVLGFELPIASAHSLSRTVANSRQAERYRVGRVFLAGDAAHIFNSGGSSLNVGMLDAVDLSARLVAVLRRHAPESELDGYATARYPAGQRAILQTRAQAALGAIDPMAAALREVLTAALGARNPQRYLRALIEGADR